MPSVRPGSYLIRRASILRYARPLKGCQGECELAAAMPRGEQSVVCVRRIRGGQRSAGKLRGIPLLALFPISHYTTIGIARLTVSDRDREQLGILVQKLLRLVVDASRLVMAIWSLSAI
jgi:hypothetical protein